MTISGKLEANTFGRLRMILLSKVANLNRIRTDLSPIKFKVTFGASNK